MFFKLSPFDIKNNDDKEWFKVLIKLESLSRKQLLNIVEKLWDCRESFISLDNMFLAYEIEHEINDSEKDKLKYLVENEFYSTLFKNNQDSQTQLQWISERLNEMDVLQIIFFYFMIRNSVFKKSIIKRPKFFRRVIIVMCGILKEKTIKNTMRKKILNSKINTEKIIENIKKFYNLEIIKT